MDIEYLSAFLLVNTGITCLVTACFAFFGQGQGRWLRVLVTFLVFLGGVAAASAALAGRNSVVSVLLNTARLDRNYVAAVGAGGFCGLVCALALQGFTASRWQRLLGQAAYVAAVLFFCSIVLKSVISNYLPVPGNADGALVEQSIVKGFRIEEYAQLSILPTSIAVSPKDGLLYVTGYSGVAYQHGVLERLERSAGTGKQEEIRVVDYLNRPHGIAFDDHGNLYVSRAGQYDIAKQGRIRQVNTGAVTRLRDLNGQGKYEVFDDIIGDLPGAHLPDGLHQNNGIAISKGYLYVGVGTSSDHGPPIHKYAGKMLRINLGTGAVEEFAKGLRNPFGITAGPDDEIFCTDNDANNTDIGDALFHVTKDANFGHPATALKGEGIEVTGITKPLLPRSKPALEGLTYAPMGSLAQGYDDCLYVASYGDSHVTRVQLTRDGKTYKAKMSFFANIPGGGALAVAVSPHEKALYVCSHEKGKIYKITPE